MFVTRDTCGPCSWNTGIPVYFEIYFNRFSGGFEEKCHVQRKLINSNWLLFFLRRGLQKKTKCMIWKKRKEVWTLCCVPQAIRIFSNILLHANWEYGNIIFSISSKTLHIICILWREDYWKPTICTSFRENLVTDFKYIYR